MAMTDRNTMARAADQRAMTAPGEVTIHDKGHLPNWRRGRGHRPSGEITFKVTHEGGVPVVTVRMVEHSGDETREHTFEVFGTSAFELLEVAREIESAPAQPWKGI